MQYEPGFDAYRHTVTAARAAAAEPHELVLMLIDGLLDELARADGHLSMRNYERKGRSISKCMQILGGLDTALDMQQGGEVARNLHQLYDYCGRKLFEVSIRSDIDELRAVVRIIENLRDGWVGLSSNLAARAAKPAA